MTKIKAKIQLRRDTSANFTSKNPTLLLGEFAFETDTMTVTESGSVSVKLKIGDGVNPWSELPYTTFGFAAVNWDDISGKPTEFTPAPHTHEITDVIGLQATLEAIASSIPAAQIQSDWNQTDSNALDFIKNKPTIPDPVTSVSKVEHDVKLGVAMTIGTPVYVPLAQDSGNNMTVLKASNASEATSSKTMGLIATGGALNDIVKVITEGLLEGVNTGSATKGDPVWLGVDGALIFGLANKPYAPAHLVFLGVVTRAQTNNGEIFVKVQNGFELKEIHDVDLITTTPINGHVLGFDGTLWVNKTIAGWLGFTPENSANKQNSLAVDGTGVKFPTVDAVNNLSMIDRGKRMVSFFTDFIGNSVTEDGIQPITVGGVIANAASGIPNRTNQQGVMYYSTAVASTNYANHVNLNAAGFWFGGGIWNYETSIYILNLSDAANRFRWLSGFGSNGANTQEGDGVFFTYDEGGTLNGTAASPNWQCVTVANLVRTLTTTSVPVSAGAWVKLRIEINAAGTSVTFYINNTLVATHTTNIPLASNNRFVLVKQGIAKTIGTAARLVYCDYLGYENILTTPR